MALSQLRGETFLAIARELAPSGTAVVRVEEARASIAVAWRRGNRSPIVRRFLDFVRAHRD